MVNKQRTLLHSRKGSVLSQADRTQVVIIADAGKDNALPSGSVAGSRCRLSAVFGSPRLGLGKRPVVDCHVVSRCSEMAEKQERLSFTPGMAIGISELGRGDDEDIYPGLYTQATLDDLLALAQQDLDGILLSSRAAEDPGLTTRIGIDVIDEQWMALGDISGSHLDLLERQLLILQRAIAPSDDDTPQGFLPF